MAPLLPLWDTGQGHTPAYAELPVYCFFFVLTQGRAEWGYPWSLRLSTALEKSYLGRESQNSRTNKFFFSVFASSKILIQSLVTEYHIQPQKHVR